MKYWISHTGKDKLIVITDEVIYNFNPNNKQLKEFEKELVNGIVPSRLTGIPIQYIQIISSKSNSTKIEISHSKKDQFKLDLAENKSEILNYLKADKINAPQYLEKDLGLLNRIQKPLIAFLIVAALSYFAYDTAINLEQGHTYEFSGRSFGLVMIILIAELSNKLGSRGIILLGLGLLCIPIHFISKGVKEQVKSEKLIYQFYN